MDELVASPVEGEVRLAAERVQLDGSEAAGAVVEELLGLVKLVGFLGAAGKTIVGGGGERTVGVD